MKSISEDASEPVDYAPRLRPLLMGLVSFVESTPRETVEELVSDLLVIAHHPRLSSVEASFWIEMLMHANVQPDELIAKSLGALLELIWKDASLTPAVRLSSSLPCSSVFLVGSTADASTLLFSRASPSRLLRTMPRRPSPLFDQTRSCRPCSPRSRTISSPPISTSSAPKNSAFGRHRKGRRLSMVSRFHCFFLFPKIKVRTQRETTS